jgi:hypothetical protein
MLNWLIGGVLALAGACIYIGRHHWRLRWDRLLLMSVAFQAAGIVLIAPPFQDILSQQAYRFVGMGLLPDFLGSVCFIAAINATIFAVAYRLMSKPYRLRGYVEKPSAAATALMLVTFTVSNNHQAYCPDFFSCPMDPWLRAYWVIWGLIGTYLVLFLVYILWAVRRIYPESRRVVDIYIAATLIGSVTGAAIFAHGLGVALNPLWMWVPLCMACGLSFLAGSWTWVRNKVQ